MFTFSKATSKTELRPSPRFRTFNGWTSTIERMRNVGSLSTKARKPILWLRRVDNTPTQSAERPKTIPKQSISPPLPLNYSPFPLVVASISPRRAEAVETTVPVYGVGSKDHHGFEPSCCAKVVLVASADASGPCRIRQIDTLPWPPILKPLPPLPVFPVPKTQPVDIASRISPASSSSSASPYYHTTTPISLEDTFDDGLDDLSHFLRRIAYEVISASTIHQQLGFMEDGGRVLSLSGTTLSVRRSISPPRRYSSLMGVSLAIMEGRLPKALMVM